MTITLGTLPGCELYFGDGRPDEPPLLPIDGPFPSRIDAGWPVVDAPQDTCRVIAYCGEAGRLYRTACLPGAPGVLPEDVYDSGVPYGGCDSRACRDDSTFAVCPDGVCSFAAEVLCRPLATCPLAGQPCTGDTVDTCTEQVACAVTAVTDTCTCRDGTYACEPAAPAVGDVLTGGWFASVSPPPFSDPYNGALSFRTDRTYDAQRAGDAALFYYGQDGEREVFRWRPVGTTASGGVATLDIYFGTHSIRTALLTDIRREGTRVRFTFWDSWLDCSRPFRFDLAPVD